MIENKHRGKRIVMNKEGRWLGVRHVLYCRDTKMYLSGDCVSATPDRLWAWSGTPVQARNARKVYNVDPSFELHVDGTEQVDV